VAIRQTGELMNTKTAPIPIGIVGAGRSRNGLGPFLAGFLEAGGFVVAGVSGRSFDRAAANAEVLNKRLGHEIDAFASPAELCASGVAALAICSPTKHHLEALRAAAESGLPTLCEKPLVHESDSTEGAEIIERFARQNLFLLENCQWPYVLPAFSQLHGPLGTGKQVRVAMELGPGQTGREMVQQTLSHLLSVIQAVASPGPETTLSDVSIDDPSFTRVRNLLQFRLTSATKTVEGALHLKVCAAPPRPAWLEIDGRRMERRIGPGYSFHFSANGSEVAIADPTTKLVEHFGLLMRTRDPGAIDLDRTMIRQRLGWYGQILARLK
jgi:Oxidoreductase family, NAD-binding Rossmann fold